MDTIVFLDLEETVIDERSNALFLPQRIDKIKLFLSNMHGPRLGLMSWAVSHDADKERFNKVIRKDLESILDFKFDEDLVWSMDDWAEQVFLNCSKKVSRCDLFDLCRKQETLFLLRSSKIFTDTCVFLIDDAVEHNLRVANEETNTILFFKNIKKM